MSRKSDRKARRLKSGVPTTPSPLLARAASYSGKTGSTKPRRW